MNDLSCNTWPATEHSPQVRLKLRKEKRERQRGGGKPARRITTMNGNGGNGGGVKRRHEMDVMEIASGGSFGVGPDITTQAEVYSDKLDFFSKPPTER